MARIEADILILGGGAAGCVLAARLSEEPSWKVVLVEAGPDTPPGATPADITDVFPRAYANPAYFWPSLEAEMRPGTPSVPFSQARILGGGSTVMGMWSPRGVAADYDGWREAGAAGWGFDDVLPYFMKLERDLDHPDAPGHGHDGPTPIMRRLRRSWPRFTEAVAAAAERKGLPFLPDLNGSDADGVAEMPFSTDGHTRTSAASAYLDATVRARPNLQVLTRTEATGLLIENGRAGGARVRRHDGAEDVITAARTIVSCGAIHSPALLMRSGVGPAEVLRSAGVPVVSDNPAVGQNLQNHPFMHLGCIIRRPARQDPALRSYAMACIRTSSGHAGSGHGSSDNTGSGNTGGPASDLFLGVLSRTGPRSTDTRVGMIAVCLYSPFSRGRVRITGPGNAPLKVELNLLHDPRDADRLVAGARLARDLLTDPHVAQELAEIFVLPAKLPIRLLNRPGLQAHLLSGTVAGLLGLGSGARHAALTAYLGRDRILTPVVSQDAFRALVVESATSMFHPGGTCALGAVVDPTTAVKGLRDLFVADASIMPKLPRANTNIPTIMVAERAAVLIRDHARNA